MTSPVIQFKRGAFVNLPGLRAGEPGFTTDKYDFYIGLTSETSTNKFFGSGRYWGREDGSTSLRFKLVDKNGTNHISLKAPDTLSGVGTYTLPDTSTIVDGYFLKVGSNGDLSWHAINGSNGIILNPVITGITTISGALLDVNSNSNFSGITTFSNTDDNTLGDSNSGAVQINGGLGIDKNVTVGGNLNVQGYSEFVGVVTFKGGTINLGDDNNDVIDLNGRIGSDLVPNVDNTYNIGISTLNWKHAYFSGIGTFETGLVADGIRIGLTPGTPTIDTISGDLHLNSNGGSVIIYPHVDIYGDLDVSGNISLGGTTITLRGTEVLIENKDIILGYTTSVTPNDTTANHAGVAIASTEGTPLVSFVASGINTLPDTYKQLMWFKSGTLGFSTDAFAFNYGVAIGTTTMAEGVRLAVGSNITLTDNTINATTANFTNLTATNITGSLTGTISTATRAHTVDTVTASDNAANYYITFVNSHNGTATAETVYTDDAIYYNPGTNTLITGNADFVGNVVVNGTLTGTATTATRATSVDVVGTSDNNTYYATFVDTSSGQNSETIRTGTALSLNASTGNVKSSGDLLAGSGYLASSNGTRSMYMYDTSGDVSFQGKIIANNIRSSTNSSNTLTLSDLDATFARNLLVVGITTVAELRIGTGVAATQFSTSVSTGNSTTSVPTSSAIIDYVQGEMGAMDLTLGINADTGGPSTVETSQILTIAGTANEVETSVSGQTITVGLPNTVVVGTSLSAPTIKVATIQQSNGTQAATIDTSGNIVASQNLTVTGNLYVNGSTTQVNTETLTVEDRLIEAGKVQTSPPSDSTWDVGILFNYYKSSVNKRAGVFWDDSVSRLAFASDTSVTNDSGTASTDPLVSVTTWAPIEIGALWVNDCAGQSQVITCSDSERLLQNITIDAGTF